MTQAENNHQNNHQTATSFFDMVRRLMPDSTQQGNAVDELASIETEEHAASEASQFNNNLENELATESSTMPHEARRVLVYLMRQGAVLAAENLKLFQQMCRYETAIRQHLAEVYIQLVLDSKQGVAYIINAESMSDIDEDVSTGSDDFPTLIRKRTLTLYDTLVLLILRKYYQERETAGEQRIIIDVERIQASLIPFIPITNHDSKDRKKLSGSLEKLSEKKVLSVLRGEEGRYEITPIIRYVVNAEFLQNLLTEYEQLANKTSATDSELETQGDTECKK